MDELEFAVPSSGDPGKDAVIVLQRIYSMFGVPAEEIPYVTDGRVDEAAIKAAS